MDNTPSLIELTKRFPDDAAAEAWFLKQRWAGRGTLSPLCEPQHSPPPTPLDAVSVSDLSERLLRQDQIAHARLEPGVSDLGLGFLSDCQQPQRDIECPARALSRDHAEDRLVLGAPDT